MGERREEGADARCCPTGSCALVSRFDSSVRQIVPELGKVKQASNAKAKRVLGWAPRSNDEALVATAESLLRLR